MTPLALRPQLRRLVVAVAWVAVALSLVHLALDSTRPRSVDVHGLYALAAIGAAVLAALAWLGRGPWTSLASGVGGALVAVAAAGLLLAGGAHETGVLLALLGVGIAVLSLDPRPLVGADTGDEAR